MTNASVLEQIATTSTLELLVAKQKLQYFGHNEKTGWNGKGDDAEPYSRILHYLNDNETGWEYKCWFFFISNKSNGLTFNMEYAI